MLVADAFALAASSTDAGLVFLGGGLTLAAWMNASWRRSQSPRLDRAIACIGIAIATFGLAAWATR